MSSTHEPRVSLNERVSALATVLTDGNLTIGSRDPFDALLPPAGSDGPPIRLTCYPCDAMQSTIIELSTVIAKDLAPDRRRDGWAMRQARKLFNVYLVYEDDDDRTHLKAQSSLIADGLGLPVLGKACILLAEAARQLREDLNEQGFSKDPEVDLTKTQEDEAPRNMPPADIPIAGYL